MNKMWNKQNGFTLVELVTVIVIIGVLAVSATTFLRFGTQSYTDAADRDELISTARFVVERLNREVRNALPNSMRIVNGSGKQCLEFTPIARSATYLDIPVAPEAARNTITLAPFASALVNNSSRIAVYALNSNDVYDMPNGVIAGFESLSLDYEKHELNNSSVPVVLTLSALTQFKTESPTNRLYFIGTATAYCLEGSQLFRYEGYVNSAIDNIPVRGTNNGKDNWSLMAEYIDNSASSFDVANATLQRNSLVQVRLAFFKNSETIVFNNEVQVPNVP
ncbi:PulJ/GspJ family protein [Cognaticolwellia mytili]|uniref:PulJ/GspJ family protein n=1 Tax=Cognaticolwellia mytili TaxID=1888913 RepID=UPI000A17562F|nr:type II secretion system protein [Cognaticolwellia mytili]